jgi:acetyl-CoA synthetase
VSHESSGTNCFENFTWYQEWEKWLISIWEANIKWFVDAKVNITKIVLTDTLPKKGDKTAIILNRMTQAKKHYIFLY